MSTYTTEGAQLFNGLLLTVGYLAGKGEIMMAECVMDATERVFGKDTVASARAKLEGWKVVFAAKQQATRPNGDA
jgi:hypothetical protein